MEICVFTEPQQGASYDQLLAVAGTAQDCGFDGFFRSDHYLAFAGDGLPGPTDAWTTIAGLARDTSRLRLGTLVSPATFREPAVLALQVAQIDQMSAGRVELGLGAGWFESEHAAFGLPFPTTRERFDVLAEQLEILTGLWALPMGERYSFAGSRHTVVDNPGLPKPVQRPVPLIIGGGGPVRTPRLAAQFGTEYNTGFGTVDDAAATFARVRAACVEAGRDPDTLRLSYAGTVVVGRDDAELTRRGAAAGVDVEALRTTGFAGTPLDVVQRVGALAAVGVQRCYLQMLDLSDLAHLELIGEQVLPRLS